MRELSPINPTYIFKRRPCVVLYGFKGHRQLPDPAGAKTLLIQYTDTDLPKTEFVAARFFYNHAALET